MKTLIYIKNTEQNHFFVSKIEHFKKSSQNSINLHILTEQFYVLFFNIIRHSFFSCFFHFFGIRVRVRVGVRVRVMVRVRVRVPIIITNKANKKSQNFLIIH